MAPGDADDTSVPTGRGGADPLIVSPKRSTGHTGQIERPGDQTPWWFVPGLCAVAVFFIGLLATINQDRTSDRLAAEELARAVVESDVADARTDTAEPSSSEVDPNSSTTPTTAAVDPRLEQLPPPGTVSVRDTRFPIVSRCEVQSPFDPVDTGIQVSSYFFFDGDGERQLLDRTFDGQTDRARLLSDERFVRLDEIGDAGAFAATFTGSDGVDFEVVVNPGVEPEQQCADRLVTNEPGQFSEPHTRIILDVCIDRTTDSFATVVGLASEGTRFEILQAGGELGEIVFVERGIAPKRTTAPASIIRSGDVTSASGVVSQGANDLDITIDIGNDITEAEARTCVASDRL